MGYRLPPTAARRVGYELATPREVELAPSGELLRCRERRGDETIGELEIEVFHAALVIDRDGILEEKVRAGIATALAAGAHVLEAVPFELGGATGYRVEAEFLRGGIRPALPYVYVFAIAPDDLGVDAGVLVTVRSASPEWPAADEILRSLRLLCRRSATANDVR